MAELDNAERGNEIWRLPGGRTPAMKDVVLNRPEIVSRDTRLRGRIATRMLPAEIRGEPGHEYRTVVLEPELIARQSTVG